MATINGTNGNNLIDQTGSSEADDIDGKGGDDTIIGGAFDDTIAGGKGNDGIDGGDGNDDMNAGDGNDTVHGGLGDDTIRGWKDDDLLYGDGGNDDIDGGSGNDTIFGGDGNDVIDGVSGSDVIDGGDGADTINAGSSDDTVDGGDGDDEIEAGSGHDSVDGGAGDDSIEGGSGSDTIAGGSGDDTIIGGSGMDTAVFAGSISDFMLSTSGNAIIVADQNAADGDEGTDTIDDDVELLQFDDATIDLTDDNAPVVLNPAPVADEDNPLGFALTVVDFEGDNVTLDAISISGTGSIVDTGSPTPGSTGLGSATNFNILFSPNGTYDYLADGETAVETVTVTVSDENGNSRTQTFDFTINGVNDDPTANGDTASTDEDSAVTIAGAALVANDTDPDGTDVLSVLSVDASGSTGTATLNGSGDVVYDPNGAFESLAAGETATDTFTYTVTDGNGGTDAATVTVTINGVNDAPTANGDTASTDEDSAVTIAGAALVANDTDPDGTDVLSVLSVDDSGSTGTATLNGSGDVVYDPDGAFESLAAGETATDTFTYTVTDGNGGTDAATVTVTINGVNDAPTANGDTASTDEDSAVTIAGAALVANDTDPDGTDVLSVLSVDASGSAGTATLNGSGDVVYDPDGAFESLAAGETATDTFTYTVTDGNGGTDAATVTVTINGVNDAPTANGDTASTDEDSAVTIAGAALVANDTDPDGTDVLSVLSVDDSGSIGTATLNGSGDVVYDPNGQFESLAVGETATDTFTYTVTDGNAGTDVATVTVTINGVNDTPGAVAATADVFEDNEAAVVDLNSLVGDPDASDVLTISGVTLVPGGAITSISEEGGVISFDTTGFNSLSAGDVETFQVQYTVTDDSGAANDSATETVTVNINGTNDRPVAGDDSTSIDEGSGGNLVIDLGLLASDPDANDALSYTLVSVTDSAGRAQVVNATISGSVLTINPAEFGLDDGEVETFTIVYRATDDSEAENNSDTGEIVVTVTGAAGDPPPPTNSQPVALDDLFEADDETEINIDLTELVQDDDIGDDLTIVSATIEAEGREDPVEFELGEDGVLMLDPSQFGLADGEVLTLVATYTVDDGSGQSNSSASGDVTIVITGVAAPNANTAPVANNDTRAYDEDAGLQTIDLNTLVSDENPGDVLKIVAASFGTEEGEIEIPSFQLNNGVVTFDPADFGVADGETLPFTLGYTVDDGSEAANSQASGAVTVNVTGVAVGGNSAPVAADETLFFSTAAAVLPPSGEIVIDLSPYLSDPDDDPVTVLNDATFRLLVDGVPVEPPSGTAPVLSGTFATIDVAQFELGEDEGLTAVLEYTGSDGSLTDGGAITLELTGNQGPTTTPQTVNYDLDFDTGNIVIDLAGLVSDPDEALSELTISIVGFEAGEEGGDVVFDYLDEFDEVSAVPTNKISLDPSQFGLLDGQSETSILEFTVDDGNGFPNSVATGAVTVNVTNPEPAPTSVTLNFDDLDDGDPSNFSFEVGIYEEFVFGENALVIQTNEVPGRGSPIPYTNGDVSPFNVLSNAFGEVLEIYGPGASLTDGLTEGELFDLESAFLSGVFRDGMTVTVTGFTLETVFDPQQGFNVTEYVATGAGQTFTASTGTPVEIFFDDAQFDEVSYVTFEVTGGTNAGLGGDGTQIMLDDVFIFL